MNLLCCEKRRRVIALFKSIFLRNRSLSNARWFYGKKTQNSKVNNLLRCFKAYTWFERDQWHLVVTEWRVLSDTYLLLPKVKDNNKLIRKGLCSVSHSSGYPKYYILNKFQWRIRKHCLFTNIFDITRNIHLSFMIILWSLIEFYKNVYINEAWALLINESEIQVIHTWLNQHYKEIQIWNQIKTYFVSSVVMHFLLRNI